MGNRVETLADLLKPGLRAVCIGINPALVSVQVGHYYQGRLGQKLYERFRRVGLLPPKATGWEDDAAFAAGLGFTDIVKRPSISESEIRREEYEYGGPVLADKLKAIRARLIVFSFKKAAQRYFGPFEGNGLIQGLEMAGAPVFVMPGPYENSESVAMRLAELRAILEGKEQSDS